MESVAKIIAEKLMGGQYAFRGTASLVLQGLDMGLDDIDVLCDEKTALSANLRLSEYLVEEVSYKESPKFKSYFGKFLIDSVDIDVYGSWQIYNSKKGWSKIYNVSPDEITCVNLDDIKIPVTKIETELEMYAFMERWSVFHKVKRLSEESGKISIKPLKEKPKNIQNQQKLF